MRFKINKHNYNDLSAVAEFVRQAGDKKLEIFLSKDNTPFLGDVLSVVYEVLDDYERYFQIILKNIPYCVVSKETVDHVVFDIKNGDKIKDCKKCKWNKNCGGFSKGYLKKYGSKEVCSQPDLPAEVMIEVTPKCNFKCDFCFNKISFAKHGRGIKPLSASYVKKIIDNVSSAGIQVIRFTGGEPLLRKDIFTLFKYAKSKNLEVRLNTNGYLIDKKIAEKLKGIVDNVLIPIESWSDKKEEKITGVANALSKKKEAIDFLKEKKIPIVRVGTVATKENILNFDKLADFVDRLDINEWEFYRPVEISKKENLNSKLVNILVNKLIDFRQKTDKIIFIANALPFCVIKDLNKINIVSKGSISDDGHSRLVVDPRGFVKPHYFINKNIGDPLNILKAWNSPFMKKIRGLEYLPKECQNCFFIFKCRGGSRNSAMLFNGGYDKVDPLANFSFRA